MQDYTQLEVWQKAHELTLALYELTRALPVEETYELSAQIRRGAAAVPSAIAQACGWDSPEQTTYYLQVAAGAVAETQYRVLLARDLSYIDEDAFRAADSRLGEVQRLLTRFIGRVAENTATESRDSAERRGSDEPDYDD